MTNTGAIGCNRPMGNSYLDPDMDMLSEVSEGDPSSSITNSITTNANRTEGKRNILSYILSIIPEKLMQV